MLVWKEGKLLLIERKKFPFGFAAPSGHLDGDSFESAAKRELQEEVGLDTVKLKLILKERKDNQCRRENGDWHNWEIFEVEAKGKIKRSLEETKSANFYDIGSIKKLAQRTKDYDEGKISEEDWQASPGLEKAYLEHLVELKII